jgi:cation diffusion facilitator family transporter
MLSSKIGAARLLLAVVIGLIILKGVVSWITSSISVLAQAADSLLDLVSGTITLMAVRVADKQADEEHPYGHGKVDDIAGVTQGVLIFVAGGAIIYSAIQRILSGAVVNEAEAGMAVMVFSILVSILLSRHLRKVAGATNSAAMEATANNIAADVYSALAVLVGLIAVRLTGLNIIDPVIAIAVALYILKIGYDTVRKPFSKLIDARVPSTQEAVIKKNILKHSHEVVGFHSLRSRQSGAHYYVDIHVVMHRDISLQSSHDICDQIEAEIGNELPDSSIVIHTEPCSDECRECIVICSDRKS